MCCDKRFIVLKQNTYLTSILCEMDSVWGNHFKHLKEIQNKHFNPQLKCAGSKGVLFEFENKTEFVN